MLPVYVTTYITFQLRYSNNLPGVIYKGPLKKQFAFTDMDKNVLGTNTAVKKGNSSLSWLNKRDNSTSFQYSAKRVINFSFSRGYVHTVTLMSKMNSVADKRNVESMWTPCGL